VTVRLRETDGRAATAELRMAGGIEAAWRTDLIEETEGAALAVADGAASVSLAPFETVTLAVRPGLAVAPAEAVALPEPVQPVYTRYWLHGKGPAPAGNVPVAVHFTPTRVTLRVPGEPGEPGEPGGDALTGLTLTVACGPEAASGEVELIVPTALTAVIQGDAARYDLAAGEFAAWNVVISALPGAADGRYFVAARIKDASGQVLEDTALVTIGEAGGPDPGQEPEELFFRLQSDVMALMGEADLELLTPALRLAPGEAGELTMRVSSHLGSQLRGEAQLVSPIGTWGATAPWTQAVEVVPGGETTVTFRVTIGATAEPGWNSWLLVKLMYFGRVHYSPAIPLTVSEP
jgi:hypothetical protein